jgi:lipid-A-disaccharide synthase
MDNKKKVMLVAGEASGDIAASGLIKSTLSITPDVEFFGISGNLSIKSGLRSIFPYEKLGVFGITAVLKQYKVIKQALDKCEDALKTEKPDLLVLVDYPGFNLKLAKIAHKLNIKVLYYISPKIWVWKKDRINTIKETVDHMAVIFPFEVDIYKDAEIPVTLVAHPSIKQSVATKTKNEFCKEHNISQSRPITCIMPGSRRSEIEYILPILKDVVASMPVDHQFLMPIATTINKKEILNNLAKNIYAIEDDQYNAINASDNVIVASGTASLEVALLEKPMCIVYKTSLITYLFAKYVVKIPYVGLPNIIAKRLIIPELLQYDATVENIKAWILKTMGSDNKDTINNLRDIRKSLETKNQEGIGKCVINLLNDL